MLGAYRQRISQFPQNCITLALKVLSIEIKTNNKTHKIYFHRNILFS